MIEAAQLINQDVVHKNFGRGIICSVEDESHLSVKFEGKDAVSRFVYPQCFYGFLTLENSRLQFEIAQTVKNWKEENGIAEKEKLYHQHKETVRGIQSRRLAAEEKRLKAAQRLAEHRTTYTKRPEDKK